MSLLMPIQKRLKIATRSAALPWTMRPILRPTRALALTIRTATAIHAPMTSIVAAIILVATFATAFLSGIFGMAGGLILMVVLTATVPVAMAMVLHGAIMMVGNGYRAYLLRNHVNWSVFARYAAGSVVSVGVLTLIAYRPDKQMVFLMIGLMAMLVWLPKRALDLDIQKRGQAEAAGVLVQTMNTIAGVAGPMLDLFFVRTNMTRHQIVATKSVTQMLAHLVKIAFWSLPLIIASDGDALPPAWLIPAAIPLSMLGTWLGGRVLDRMKDAHFQHWMKGLVTSAGAVCLLRAAGVF